MNRTIIKTKNAVGLVGALRVFVFLIALILMGIMGNVQTAHALQNDQVLVTCANHDATEGRQCAACWGDPQEIQTGYIVNCKPNATTYCASHGGIDTSPLLFKDQNTYEADYTCFTGTPPVDGVCGTANSNTYSSAPHTPSALCQYGTASAVSGSVVGPWSWTCAGSNGGASASCGAQTCAAPILALTASPTTVIPGGSTTLSWTIGGYDSCVASSSPGSTFSGAITPVNGSQIATPAVTTTYSLTCHVNSTNHTDTSNVTVTVAQQNGCYVGTATPVGWGSPTYDGTIGALQPPGPSDAPNICYGLAYITAANGGLGTRGQYGGDCSGVDPVTGWSAVGACVDSVQYNGSSLSNASQCTVKVRECVTSPICAVSSSSPGYAQSIQNSSDCISSLGYRPVPQGSGQSDLTDILVTSILRQDGNDIAYCHMNRDIETMQCPSGNGGAGAELIWDHNPICNQSYPTCTRR